MLPLTLDERKRLRSRLILLINKDDTWALVERYILSNRRMPNPEKDAGRLAYESGALAERIKVVESFHELLTDDTLDK